MTDKLRKAAQDVVAWGDWAHLEYVSMSEAVEALRAALAETPEPVASNYPPIVFVYRHKLSKEVDAADWDNAHFFESNPHEWELIASLNAVSWIRYNYDKATTPSVDALIGELDGLRVLPMSNNDDSIAFHWNAIAEHDLKPILDKYRAKDKP